MSEAERRRKYRWGSILIEKARILDPQFDDAVVFLSGAQIELLRNASTLLDKRDTYVAAYHPGYYLVPTDEDYDTIRQIVADLEETLMGNPNTLWGYDDRWKEDPVTEGIGAGLTENDMTAVPSGYVYHLEHITLLHTGGSALAVTLAIKAGGYEPILYNAPALSSGSYEIMPISLTLKEGDYLQMRVSALPVGTYAYLRLWGTKMVVPA